MCACVLGSLCILFFLLGDVFEGLKCCLDPWLSCMFDCICLDICDSLVRNICYYFM